MGLPIPTLSTWFVFDLIFLLLLTTLSFPDGFPLSIIIVGVIGGLILTTACILIVVLCRRNSTLSCNSNSFKIGGNGSDITAFTSTKSGLQRYRNNGSDSDNSADYKVDIRFVDFWVLQIV